MSVTVGDFFGNGLVYASGAPRSNGTGQVILFTRTAYVATMDVTTVLNGEQFASSFGYEIAAADVNGDKYVLSFLLLFFLLSSLLFFLSNMLIAYNFFHRLKYVIRAFFSFVKWSQPADWMAGNTPPVVNLKLSSHV